MRRIHRRKDKAKAKPGIYEEFIKKKSGERNGASSATYDDLFGPKPGNDSLDWAAFDEDIESTSTPTTPNSPSLRSSIGKRISSVKSKAKRSGPRISLMGFRGRKPANMDESDLEEVEADRARASEIDEEEVSDVDSMSVASGTSRLSRASFEDVFGRSVVNTDDIDDDFQFNNPSKWRDNSAAKEAVYDVLAKGGSTMHMARKLFLLEQLKHPAPPSEPPVYWNRTAGINGARNRRNKNRKSFYVVPSAGEGEDGVMPEVFWTVGDVVSHAKHIDLGWPIRADFLLDTAKHLGKLHHGGYVHGSLQAKNVLLDDNLHVYLRSCSTLRPMTKKEFRSHESRNAFLQKDIFWVGVLILELALGLPLSQMECPSLRSAIKMEEKMRFDELEELNDEVDTEIRSLLKDVEPPIPSSLVELCAQCVSPVRLNRPEADDIIDWLKDLRSDLEDPDTPSRLDVARHVLGSQRLALKPAVLFDVAQVPTNFDEDGDGYESEDSYAPPEGAEEAGLTVNGPRKNSGRGSSGGNMLQAFLSATADSSRSNASLSTRHEPEKPRPKSMMLPTGLNSMFDSIGGYETSEAPELSGSSSMFDGTEHRPRRRSLDRGYYFARNQAMEQHDEVDRRQLISKANMQKFKKAVMTKLETMSTKPIDPEKLAKRLDAQEVIGTDEAAAIIKRADTILRSEPNLLQLNAVKSGGVTVVGDIHGQYYDLRNLIRLAGQPGSGKGKTTYLFLGDFVDRGDWGAEVMLYLFALKAYHPAHVWLLRGNHEARSVSSFFGFKEECEKKYGLTIYNRFCEAFQAMPIASTIDTATGKFLCLHGGISPNVETLSQFIEFDRFVEPAMNGFLCDVLWSDPVVDPFESGEDQTLNEFLAVDYLPNSQRGCAYRFGFRAIVSFLAVNGLVGVIRAHEVKEEGYCYHFQDLQGNGTKSGKPDTEATPPVITVFSAPNYCGRYGNKAAFLRVLDKPQSKKHRRKHNLKPIHILNPVQYTAVEHPEPVQFEETEQQKQSVRIETTCPYMPSTFNAFIRKAIELGEAEARRGLVRRKPSAPSLEEVSRTSKSKSKRSSKKEKKPPPMPPRQASSDTLTDGSTENKPSKSNWKAAELLGFDEGAAAGTNKAKHKAPNKQYADAAASDGINEMNPLVVQDKMKVAKSKLKPNQLKGKILVSKSGSHHSLLKNKDRSASEAARDASLVPKDVATKPPDGDTITFSTNELIALQMLYLLIDHRDKGFITAEDLVQWSAEEGATVRLSEAQMCISYVDADMDSKVGFEDYLVFAAKNKENWLIKQYNKVMTQVKILQSESSTSLV